MLSRRPKSIAEAFAVYQLACKVGDEKLRDAYKVEAARHAPFTLTPFEYLPSLGAKGCQLLVGLFDATSVETLTFPSSSTMYILLLSTHNTQTQRSTEKHLKTIHELGLHEQLRQTSDWKTKHQALKVAAVAFLNTMPHGLVGRGAFAEEGRLRELIWPADERPKKKARPS